MIKKILSQSTIYGLGPIIPKFANILILPIITKYLTPLDYGIYGVLMAYSGIIGGIRTLGLNVTLVNSFYHFPGMYKWVWRQVYGFLILWSIPFNILAVFLYLIAIPTEAQAQKWLLIALLILPTLIAGSSTVYGNLFYQLHQRPKQIAFRGIIIGFINIVITYYTIVILRLGYLGWFWALAISGVLQNLSYFFPLIFVHKIRPIFNFKWRLIKQALGVSTPNIPHQYAYYLLHSSDRVIMDTMQFTSASIGNYNVAYTLGNYYSMGIEAMNKALSPMMMAMHKLKDEKTLRDLGLLWFGFSLTLSFIICLFLKEIFSVLFSNEALAKNYYLAVFIIMAMNYRPIYAAFVSRLYYYERTNLIWRITLTAGLFNVGSNLLFLKKYGIEIAAVTTFLSFMFMAYAGFYYKKVQDLIRENYYPTICLGLTIAYTLIARWAVWQPISYRLSLIVLALLLASVFIHKNRETLKRLKAQKY